MPYNKCEQLIECLDVDSLIDLSILSLREKGRRIIPYNIFKWWGRRPALQVYALLLSFFTEKWDDVREAIKIREDSLKSPFLNIPYTIVDPFCGGGTTAIESYIAGFRKIYCFDINPIAVLISKSTLNSCICEKCTKVYEGLFKALRLSFHDTKKFWCIDNICSLHLFLTRNCNEETCNIPKWLTIRKKKKKTYKILINEEGKLSEVPLNYKVSPLDTIEVPKEKLVFISNNLYAYAMETFSLENTNRNERLIVSLLEKNTLSMRAKKFIEKSQSDAKKKVEKILKPTKIPLAKETKRLYNYGIEFFESLFTPRQLLSLLTFIGKARNIKESILITGNAMRSCSLLAYYYQPYGKVNPGLIVKSYWVPKYPVELNPLAYTLDEEKQVKSIGRGTLSTYIRAYLNSCKKCTSKYRKTTVVAKVKDATIHKLPKNADIIFVDPPYPGKQSYDDLSLLYQYAFRVANDNNIDVNIIGGLDALNIKSYLNSIKRFVDNLAEINEKTKILLMLNAPTNKKEVELNKNIINLFINNNFNLIKIYWLLAEAPGILGRGRARGITVILFGRNNEFKINCNYNDYKNFIDKYRKKLIEKLEEIINNENELTRLQIQIKREHKYFMALVKALCNL